METPRGDEQITDDEVLYRRVPERWCSNGAVDRQAFRPHPENDADGLSLSRAKYKTPEQAATTTWPGKRYFIAVLYASKLRAIGLDIKPAPLAGDPGHCVLPILNASNRRSDGSRHYAGILALGLTADDILGPFGPFS